MRGRQKEKKSPEVRGLKIPKKGNREDMGGGGMGSPEKKKWGPEKLVGKGGHPLIFEACKKKD